MESLDQLRERRAYECRLTPDRALQTLDEAEEFLRERGLLTRTADSALQWPWFGELAERGYLVTAVHRGKNLIVTEEVARLLDPICRAEIDRMRAADPQWDWLLDHLAVAGPSNVEDLQVELELKPKELKSLRSPLERCGAIVSRSLQVTAGHGHSHSSELARWDQVFPEPSGDGDLADLVVAAVRAAVVAPEREVKRWFSWPWYWDDSLLHDARLVHVDGHLAAAT